MKSVRTFSTRSTRTLALLRPVLLVIGGIALSSSLAAAQSGTFTLATEAHWGNVTLPAGTYSYSVAAEPSGKITTIRSQKGNWGAMVLSQSVSEAPTMNNQLVLAKRGDKLFVSALCLKDPGLVLNYPVPAAKQALSAAVSPEQATVASASTR
jgi:hypothetical protein